MNYRQLTWILGAALGFTSVAPSLSCTRMKKYKRPLTRAGGGFGLLWERRPCADVPLCERSVVVLLRSPLHLSAT